MSSIPIPSAPTAPRVVVGSNESLARRPAGSAQGDEDSPIATAIISTEGWD
jgi:hypothetical protein